jgi:glycosyltransferase involved in cell wall biosynthesis
MNKLVSIITPNYNSEKFIAKTISSVLEQTYEHWEMIIVDDASTDNSIKIINTFLDKDSRIQLHQLSTNVGAGVARNKAIEVSKGSFIAFLDSDDLWLPKKLEEQISFMNRNKYHFTHTSYEEINENGATTNKIINCKKKMNYAQMLNSNKIGCLTAVYNKDVLGKVYMPNIRKRQDYALWLQILKKEKFVYGIQKNLARYRDRSNSISNNKIEMLQWNWRLYTEVENLSYFRGIYYLLANIINKILK